MVDSLEDAETPQTQVCRGNESRSDYLTMGLVASFKKAGRGEWLAAYWPSQ
jgi:hypothetical protein